MFKRFYLPYLSSEALEVKHIHLPFGISQTFPVPSLQAWRARVKCKSVPLCDLNFSQISQVYLITWFESIVKPTAQNKTVTKEKILVHQKSICQWPVTNKWEESSFLWNQECFDYFGCVRSAPTSLLFHKYIVKICLQWPNNWYSHPAEFLEYTFSLVLNLLVV